MFLFPLRACACATYCVSILASCLSLSGQVTTEPPVDATRAPTIAPTLGPTRICNQEPALRELLMRVIINTVSDSTVVATAGTPQNAAMMWITQNDTRFLCPDDPSLKRRYSLAVFYYSTRGGRWLECTAPANFTDPASIEAANALCTIEPFPMSGTDAWLSPSDECQWGGVVCDDEGNLQLLDIGTCV
jgi:hypothetical protein